MFFSEFSNVLRELVDRFNPPGLGPGILKVYFGFTPIVLLTTANTAEALFMDNINLKRPMGYHFLKRWLGDSILILCGEKWRLKRKAIVYAFHSKKMMEGYLVNINGYSARFVDFIGRRIQENPKEVRLIREISRCTLDIMAATSLGSDLNCINGDNYFGTNLAQFQLLVLARHLRPWMWWDFVYYNFTSEGKMEKRCIKNMSNLSNNVLQQHKAKLCIKKNKPVPTNGTTNGVKACPVEERSKPKFKTFLDVYLNYFSKNLVSEMDVRNETDGILFAGQDTTSTAVSFTLYLLGLYPEHQERCRQEVFYVVGDNNPMTPITTDHLKEFEYLNACLLEAMRLFPPVPLIGRHLTKDVTVKGGNATINTCYKIPAGVQVFTSIFHLHRDPLYFPEPDKFWPERFLNQDSPHRQNPFAYVPFAAGPRNCAGSKYATMTSKVILAHMLRNFTFRSTRPIERLKLCFGIVTRSKGDLRVQIRPLHYPPNIYKGQHH
ncbi:cytochrome P450 4V2-like [Tropilaelaps mercedesae]|uniref:Cytochrome P450 4V2-like n=1 Tax=Tropilaelaps mercedesae TaxID=418985 RepID=A0A1V9XWX8_9ACAR|nr:cytochrome P450 4V2-like [Tropilaelaps mercedesae]